MPFPAAKGDHAATGTNKNKEFSSIGLADPGTVIGRTSEMPRNRKSGKKT